MSLNYGKYVERCKELGETPRPESNSFKPSRRSVKIIFWFIIIVVNIVASALAALTKPSGAGNNGK